MNVATSLREARKRAGMTQSALARETGTSQATISAYESGRKEPSVRTLDRLLAATGSRLAVEPATEPVSEPSAEEHRRAARSLLDVLALAEALPTRHDPTLRFPRLPSSARQAA
jgi:transcriptional regulator with XRE-family HTH domain